MFHQYLTPHLAFYLLQMLFSNLGAPVIDSLRPVVYSQCQPLLPESLVLIKQRLLMTVLEPCLTLTLLTSL
jgi:hypothetical protein